MTSKQHLRREFSPSGGRSGSPSGFSANPTAAAAAAAAGQSRPKTPTMKSRLDEKNALIGLNNRLANILQRKQELEDENSLLGKELLAERENTIKTLTRLQFTYDSELDNVRKLLEDSEKERAKLQMHCQRSAKAAEEANARLDKKEADRAALEQKMAQAKAACDRMAADLDKASEQLDRAKRDNQELLEDKARLVGELEELRLGLEREALAKIELQSAMKGSAEEFAVKSQIFEQEIVNIKKHREIEIQEMDQRLQKKYETMLENDIQALRDEYDRHAAANKEALDNLYHAREADLKSHIHRLKDSLGSKGDEVSGLQGKLESLAARLSAVEGERVSLQQIIQDLQGRLEEEEAGYSRDRARLEAELEELRRQKENLIKEYQDLWDTKVALDNEIATYHMLLEGEERRLSMEGRPKERTTTTTTSSSSYEQQQKASFTVV